ncbi:hypothetical protein JZO70_17845 [Enterococcus sp. 669A]|uniref:Uncharacterized protein n=1 Tax=Candidatus Enterococcus moelleringii TaxID=2815325 RepID=A0ABS3LG84_9ENTE|nr:hypothetical protein [Enterococcus sp. 669A]MBO1308043.1 hypothetical protein [Enterococcus sp. 669A]
MKALQQKQLFSLTRRNLEARIRKFAKEGSNPAYLIQCAVVILLRNAFSPENFSLLAKEEICQLFLTGDLEALSSVRHLCVYFKEYFSNTDWEKLIIRLFGSEKEYLNHTATLRAQTDHLHKYLHGGKRQPAELMDIATVYKDAAGKKHRFTLKGTDPCYSVEETTALLSILTTLTLFEKDGVRRFTELFRYIYLSTTPVYDRERDEQAAETDADTDSIVLQEQLDQALEALALLKVNNEPGAGLLMESPDFLQKNVYAGKTSEEIAAHMFDGYSYSPEDDPQQLHSRMMTALIGGLKLKEAPTLSNLVNRKSDAPPKDTADEPETPLQDPPKGKKKKSKRRKKEGKVYLTKEEMERQRKEKELDQKTRKKLGKKKRGKKKKR